MILYRIPPKGSAVYEQIACRAFYSKTILAAIAQQVIPLKIRHDLCINNFLHHLPELRGYGDRVGVVSRIRAILFLGDRLDVFSFPATWHNALRV